MEDMSQLLGSRASYFIASMFALVFIFTTTNSYAFDRDIHEDITEEELQGIGFDEGSADEVGDSSFHVDTFEWWNDAAHVDNNRMDLGSERLIEKKTAVVEALMSCQRSDAIDRLGEALHTVQDVYAHTNAVDNGIWPNLLSMPRGSANCDPAAHFATDGLVSGYFSLVGWADGDQCRWMPDNMCCHRDLNKDGPSVPNSVSYPSADLAARNATRNYVQMVLDELQASVSEEQAAWLENMLKQRQRTLSFVIDDTGSMSDDISGVRSAALGVLDGVVDAGEAPTLGLVTFKDSVTNYGEFCNIDTFRSKINSLTASGGGDCPEASNSALLTALGNFPLISTDMQLRGGRIVLATDASAGDYALGPYVATQAAIRGVSIDAILTGDCYEEGAMSAMSALRTPFVPSDNNDPDASVVSAMSSIVAASASSDPLSSRSARTQLRALTSQTGGVLFNVARVEVDDVVPTLLELGAPDTAVIRSWRIRSDMGAVGDVEIPVDDTFQSQVSFMVTASTASALPSFTLIDPLGNVVDASNPDITRLLLSSVDKFTVANPSAGIWRIRFDSPGDFVVRAFGQSTLVTADVRLFDPSIPPVYPGIDIMPLEGQPAVGKELVVELAMTSAAESIDTVVLRRDDGMPLLTLTPNEIRPGRYRVSFIPTEEQFLIEMGGLSSEGLAYLRQILVPVVPQNVALLVEPKVASALTGTAADIKVTVSNSSDSAAEYTLTATSDASWSMEIPASVTVEAGGSTTLTLKVSVPSGALEGDSTNILLMAEDSANSQVRNSASAIVRAITNQPPVCEDAQASKPTLIPDRHGWHFMWSPWRQWYCSHIHDSRHHRHFCQDNMVTESIIGVTDPDDDEIGITITAITQDEPVTQRFRDYTSPDGSGVGTAEATVRNERDWFGDGRVYAIHFDADDGNGGSCSGTVNVSVPRKRHRPAVDSGQNFDSTQE